MKREFDPVFAALRTILKKQGRIRLLRLAACRRSGPGRRTIEQEIDTFYPQLLAAA